MIVDAFTNWNFYYPGNAVWRCAFEYLQSLTPEAEPGEMVPILDDRIKGRVMCYDTVAVENSVLEAHDRYLDIQMSLVNTECIDWFPRATLTVKTPYNPESDVLFFERPVNGAIRIINRPGIFTVLFPRDAHAPQLMHGATPDHVKKVVVKVNLAAVQGA